MLFKVKFSSLEKQLTEIIKPASYFMSKPGFIWEKWTVAIWDKQL